MIDGIRIKKLAKHADERGYLMEILRCDDEVYSKFGQAYVSLSYPGVIRAWHLHKRQHDAITAVSGMAKLVTYDPREDSPTHGEVNEFFVGEQNAIVVCIPCGVYHGYKAIGCSPVLIVNFPTESYDAASPDEYRLPPDAPEIPYDWGLVMR